MYFDYDTVKREQTEYETATTFWAMWAGLASPHQAALLVIKALPKFEAFGGLVSGTADSRGAIGIDRELSFPRYVFPIRIAIRLPRLVLGVKGLAGSVSLLQSDPKRDFLTRKSFRPKPTVGLPLW